MDRRSWGYRIAVLVCRVTLWDVDLREAGQLAAQQLDKVVPHPLVVQGGSREVELQLEEAPQVQGSPEEVPQEVGAQQQDSQEVDPHKNYAILAKVPVALPLMLLPHVGRPMFPDMPLFAWGLADVRGDVCRMAWELYRGILFWMHLGLRVMQMPAVGPVLPAALQPIPGVQMDQQDQMEGRQEVVGLEEIAVHKLLPRATANHRHQIVSMGMQSAAAITHGRVRMRKQASRNAIRNPVQNPVQLNQRVPVVVADPIRATTLLQAPVRNHVDRVQPPSVVRLSKNVMYIPGWDWGVIFTSATILPAEDHKDLSRAAIVPVVVEDPTRATILQEEAEDPTRATTPPEAVEARTRAILLEVVGDRVTVLHRARAPLPASRARVQVKKAPHVPVQEQSPIAPARVRPTAVKTEAGPAGMMRTMARSLRGPLMKPRLAPRSLHVSGMRLWKELPIQGDSLRVCLHGRLRATSLRRRRVVPAVADSSLIVRWSSRFQGLRTSRSFITQMLSVRMMEMSIRCRTWVQPDNSVLVRPTTSPGIPHIWHMSFRITSMF